MLKVCEIEKIFHYTTEAKDNDAEKMEKNNRRFETILRKVDEVRETIYDSKKGVTESIYIVNNKYASLFRDEEVSNAVNEIRAFYKILSNSHIDLSSKATIINRFEFKAYKRLLTTCKICGLKTASRLSNMKIMSDKFIHGELSKKNYSDDLKEQVAFFTTLLSHYEDICANNFYVYILRYDLKTIKKKRVPNRSRK